MSAVAFVRKMGIVGRLSFILLACLAVVAIVSIPQLFHKVGAWSSEPSLNTVVCAAGGNQASPVTISDGSGGAIIAWQDCRNGNSWDVYIQRMDSTGSAQWTANGIAVCTASHDQVSPVVVSDGSGGAIIAWQDRRSCSYDIYAQRVDSSGGSQWTADGVPICVASYDQVSPVAVSDGSGGAIIAWQDRRSCGYDIYAQRVECVGQSAMDC